MKRSVVFFISFYLLFTNLSHASSLKNDSSDAFYSDAGYELLQLNRDFYEFVKEAGFGLNFNKLTAFDGHALLTDELISAFLEDKKMREIFGWYYAAARLQTLGKEYSDFVSADQAAAEELLIYREEEKETSTSDRWRKIAKKIAVYGGVSLIGALIGAALYKRKIDIQDRRGRNDPLGLHGLFDPVMTFFSSFAGAVSAPLVFSTLKKITKPLEPVYLDFNHPVDRAEFSYENLSTSYVYCRHKDENWKYLKHMSSYVAVPGRWGTVEQPLFEKKGTQKIYSFGTKDNILHIATSCTALIKKRMKTKTVNPAHIEYVVGNTYKTARYPLFFYMDMPRVVSHPKKNSLKNDKVFHLGRVLSAIELKDFYNDKEK